jgi:hypothetical protein
VARPPSLDRPTGRSRAPTPRRQVRLVADLGLLLLPALAVETFTGLLLFAFRQGLIPKGGPGAQAIFDFLAANHLLALQDISFQTGLHVWAGYLTVWALLWKAWASWPTLVGWWPRRFSPGRLAAEKAAAWALLALAPASYTTGLALMLRRPDLPYGRLHDLHLWVSLALLVPLGWHVWRFFPTGLRILTVQLRQMTLSLKDDG